MIPVTRLTSAAAPERAEIIVNADLIELVEATPDTLITLTTGRKLLVREPAPEIVARVLRWRRETFAVQNSVHDSILESHRHAACSS